MYYNDPYLNNDYTYTTYQTFEPSLSVTNIEGATVITTINVGGGGQVVGPSVTLSGGVSGYEFVGAGNTITLAVDNPATVRSSIGLGTIATQDAGSVNITGGTIAGITDLAIVDGGTGASSAASARTNLGVPRIHTAAVAPAVGDDGAAGFPTGTLWVDTVLGDAYISVDDATGAAVWKQITP